MNLGSVSTTSAGSTFLNASTEPGGKPGMQAWSRDGRRFRLVKNGPNESGAGLLMQGPVPNSGHVGLTPTAAVQPGARTVTVTAGGGAGTNVPANTYAGGLMVITAGNGTGLSYAIKGHEPIVAAQPFRIDLESDDLIWFPIQATDKVSLYASPYFDIIQNVGTATSAGPVGITVGSGLPPGLWGYVQVEGLAVCLADGPIAIGQSVSPSVVHGAWVTANTGTLPVIGSSVSAGLGAGLVVMVSLSLP